MKLLLVRHAEAVDKGTEGVTRDFDRHLTGRGRDQAQALADALAARGVRPTAVVTSPLVRAAQTAEPLRKLMPNGAAPLVCDYLSPDECRPKKLSKALAAVGGELVAAVGHQPSLGEYAGWLIGAGDAAVGFEKGAAALIDCPDGIAAGLGQLVWLVTPAWVVAGAPQPPA